MVLSMGVGVKVDAAAAAARRANQVAMMALDLALAEAVRTLADRGLPCLLLKGPALAAWLYDDPADRLYGDVDLLVDPRRFEEAEQVLFDLGYRRDPVPAASHHTVWCRGRRIEVKIELHRTIHWLDCPDVLAWSLLRADPEEMMVAETPVRIMGVPGRLLTVVLHAAQHGRAFGHAVADLDRSLALASIEDWRAAAALARALGAIEPFSGGLRLRPGGTQVADRLGLPHPSSPELMLSLETPPATAFGFARLAAATGLRSALRVLLDEFVPSPDFVRAWQPMSRRGRRALLAVYLWRPAWLLWKAPAGFQAWRRAEARARRSEQQDLIRR
jgi:hypothetical protein